MRIIAILVLLMSGIPCFAEDRPKVDPKVNQILTAMVHDVLFSNETKGAREFYGTDGDKTVILLNGSGLDQKPVKWPAGFKPKIEGFTFILGHKDGVLGSEDHDRRLAIRLDRFSTDPVKGVDAKKHPFWDKSPIRISIQNGGGTKNGAVIGGQTTWYSFTKKGQNWVVQNEGAID
ncbi:hypothetical protein OAB00_03670 [Akkermansiaceae bacterium]|nr:hypothetical protein [Akkermansiaceae bacterium]